MNAEWCVTMLGHWSVVYWRAREVRCATQPT